MAVAGTLLSTGVNTSIVLLSCLGGRRQLQSRPTLPAHGSENSCVNPISDSPLSLRQRDARHPKFPAPLASSFLIPQSPGSCHSNGQLSLGGATFQRKLGGLTQGIVKF